MTGPDYPHRPADGDSSSQGGAVDPEAPTPAVSRDAFAESPPAAQTSLADDPPPDASPDRGPAPEPSPAANPAPVDERRVSRPTSAPLDPHDHDQPFDSAGHGGPEAAYRPGRDGSSGYGSTRYGNSDAEETTVVPTTPAATTPAGAPMTPPGAMPTWQSAPVGTHPGAAPGASPGSTSAIPAEPGTFFGQPSRTPEPDIGPPKSRVWQNLLGAIGGLVLVLGPVILFAVLAGTPETLFEQSTGRRLVVLGMIVIAALPALVAGWAPAAAWLPGGVLALAGTIALFSQSFVNQLQSWSVDLFGTPVVGVFVTSIGLYLGFALLFAGLGTVWARRSGVDSVLDRISPNP